VVDQSSCPLSTGKLGEYLLYCLFYPAYIFDLLKLIGEKQRTFICSTMCYDFRVIKKQKVGNKKGDISTSIQFDYIYSSEGLIQQIWIDLKNVTAIREVFLNLDASITIRTIPNNVLGFSTDWSAVIKKIQWFSSLSKPQQKEEQKYHNQLPQFERRMYLTNIRLLSEQQGLLRSAASSSSLVASSVTPTKEDIGTTASASASSTAVSVVTAATATATLGTKIFRRETNTTYGINSSSIQYHNNVTTTTGTQTETISQIQLPICYCWVTDGGSRLSFAKIIDQSFLHLLLEYTTGGE